eukprot:CAMPEP_0117627842 /NCGR_PEP_ID=MMETSP0802-20121206/2156_1 /TAXON_ID=38833 /ORGANISM="Micromonas sp., Strain CCMP2099" /LENGTH=1526 /DNA_ID=CAMNT_0005432029 /DNA_START=3046 /DNA_END=7625 /DNA_ORIENTATION=-
MTNPSPRALDRELGVDKSQHVGALWECPEGHIWPALISNISKCKSKHGGCPACSGKLQTDEKSLFALHEETFAREFICSLAGGKTDKLLHEEDWNKFRRRKLSENQARNTEADHEEDLTEDRRIELCKRQAVITAVDVEAWLAETIIIKDKDIPRAFDCRRGKEAARRVKEKSGKAALWKCAKNHYWVSTIDNRTSSKSQCPGCKGIVATAENNMYVCDYSAACELVCALAGSRENMLQHNAEWDRFSKGRALIDDDEVERWLTEKTALYETQDKTTGTKDKRETQRALHELRGKIAATDLLGKSDAPALWRCTKRRHLRISSISNRIDRKKSRSRCPFCSGNLPWEENNLYYHHPDVARSLVCVLAGGRDAYANVHMGDWDKLRDGMTVTDEAKVNTWLEDEITITKSEEDGGRKNETVRRGLSNESWVDVSKRVLENSNVGALWRCDANHYEVKQIYVRSAGWGCRDCSLGCGWTVKALRGLLDTFQSSIADLSGASIYTILELSGVFDSKSQHVKELVQRISEKKNLNALIPGLGSAADSVDTKTPEERVVIAGSACLKAIRFKRNKHSRETVSGPKNDVGAIKFLVYSQIMKLWQLAIQDQNKGNCSHELKVEDIRPIRDVIKNLEMKLSDQDEVMKNMLKVTVEDKPCKNLTGSVQRVIEQLISDASSENDEGADSDDAFYAQVLRACFVAEYLRVAQWDIPDDYNPEVEVGGEIKIITPNLMQRLTVIRLRESPHHGLGNWSDTGTGKTISALLASRDYCAHLTVILCPKPVVSNWKQNIERHLKACEVGSTFDHAWTHNDADKHPRFLVIAYSQIIQKSDGIRGHLEAALPKLPPKETNFSTRLFLIVDEIQKVKSRGKDPQSGKTVDMDSIEVGGYGDDNTSAAYKKGISQRRESVVTLLKEMRSKDEQSRVLGLTATPVINDLTEAKSLIEIITYKSKSANLENLECQPWSSVVVGIRMHRALMDCGLRICKDEPPEPTKNIDVDCTHIMKSLDLKVLQQSFHPRHVHKIEAALTEARLPKIIELIEEQKNKKAGPVLLYTHYISSIRPIIQKAFDECNIACMWFTGSESQSDRDIVIENFKSGKVHNIHVLVGTDAIMTGIDGLQNACSCLIFNGLPWTFADYRQLIGRLDRPGQRHEIIIFIIRAWVKFSDDEHWSWDDFNWQRIRTKRSIADVAVDGKVPEADLYLKKLSNKEIMNKLKEWGDQLGKSGQLRVPQANRETRTIISGATEDPVQEGEVVPMNISQSTEKHESNSGSAQIEEDGNQQRGKAKRTRLNAPQPSTGLESGASPKRTSEATIEAKKRRKEEGIRRVEAHRKEYHRCFVQLETLFSYRASCHLQHKSYSEQIYSNFGNWTISTGKPSTCWTTSTGKEWESQLSETDCVVAATRNSEEDRKMKISDVIEGMRRSQLEYLGWWYWLNLQDQYEPNKDPDLTKAYEYAVKCVQSNIMNRYILEADEQQRNVLRSDRRDLVMLELKRCIAPFERTGLSTIQELSLKTISTSLSGEHHGQPLSAT